ncbi:uncharacterized protein LOC143099197 [Alosa pseudoharengus]|uniref:uncharacterized protein LOC143099197 n=1 Tax=Alosa pseudoharengus TaxID=34774 RepID=UPI003F8CC5E4
MADITFTFLSLTMLSCVRCDITVTGYEGGNAVINCPSQNLSHPKYLLKDGVKIIQSNRRAEWTRRLSLQVKDKETFTVIIQNLTQEDAGIYFCGVDRWGWDFYIKVYLKVEVNTGGSTTTANGMPVSARVATQPSENTSRKPELTSESDFTTHIQTDPTSVSSAGLVYIGAGLAVVVFVLVLSLFMLYIQKTRSRKASAPPVGQKANPSSRNTHQVQCDYADVTISPGNHTSSHTLPGTDPSAIYSNVPPPSNQNPDSVDYSTVCFDRDEASLQYATVRFTDQPAGGDKKGSTSRDEAVIYSTINQDS